jgi:hypothetical protein
MATTSIGPAAISVGDVIFWAPVSESRMLVKRLPTTPDVDGRRVRVQLVDGPERGNVKDVVIAWSAAVTRFLDV